jgi:hypothetical protein
MATISKKPQRFAPAVTEVSTMGNTKTITFFSHHHRNSLTSPTWAPWTYNGEGTKDCSHTMFIGHFVDSNGWRPSRTGQVWMNLNLCILTFFLWLWQLFVEVNELEARSRVAALYASVDVSYKRKNHANLCMENQTRGKPYGISLFKGHWPVRWRTYGSAGWGFAAWPHIFLHNRWTISTFTRRRSVHFIP